MNRKVLPNYRDILEDRRKEWFNILWVSRELDNKLAYVQNERRKPHEHKMEVLRSAKMQELLTQMSIQMNVSKQYLEEKAKGILDEIGFSKYLSLLRCLGLLLTKICVRVCSSIYVNEPNILNLRSQMGATPVIFLPSHRSYADFILMSYVLFTYDIEIPAIASGMDFHAMWGMGSMLRETGAFFMHRSYNDDSLYWNIFKLYIHQLVTKGDTAIEFFIEGTRSRSGKSLLPKYGLLSMIMRAFFNAEVPDILLVPINISYDRVMEEKLFAYELLGVPKPKESTSAFFKSLSLLNEKYGNIYFNFGRPISAKDFFGGRTNRSQHGIKPLRLQEMNEDEKKLLPELAGEIVHSQQKLCVITPFNLISIIVTNNLILRKPPMTVADLNEEIAWLTAILKTLGALVDVDVENVEEDTRSALKVHGNLIKVDDNERVVLICNEIVLNKSNIAKLKGHDLSEKTMTKAVPFVMLQLYVNPVLHYIINSAIIIFVLKSYDSISEKDLYSKYAFLRTLFSHEFFYRKQQEESEFKESLHHLLLLKAIKVDNGISLVDDNKIETYFCNLLDPFIYSYYSCLCVLNKIGWGRCSEKTIVAAVQAELEITINESRTFLHPYSLSLDTITNCLNCLVDFRVITKHRADGIVYEIKDLIRTFIEKIETYLPKHYIMEIKKTRLMLKNKL